MFLNGRVRGRGERERERERERIKERDIRNRMRDIITTLIFLTQTCTAPVTLNHIYFIYLRIEYMYFNGVHCSENVTAMTQIKYIYLQHNMRKLLWKRFYEENIFYDEF